MSGSLSDTMITKNEACTIYAMLTDYLMFGGAIEKSIAVGSFARAASFSVFIGDIDLVVVVGNQEKFDRVMCDLFGLHKNKKPKYSGVIGKAQVDIFVANHDNFYPVVEFYTLPKNLQIAVRTIAFARGLKFGPKGLFNRVTGEQIICDRKTLYDHLGILPIPVWDMQKTVAYKQEEMD